MYFWHGILVGFVAMYLFFEIKSWYCPKLEGILQTLVRQASRWSTAALQDKNPVIAVLHANYGAGYLWAIKDIANESQVYHATGANLKKLEEVITKTQDEVTMNLISECSSVSPPTTYLSEFAKEGYT